MLTKYVEIRWNMAKSTRCKKNTQNFSKTCQICKLKLDFMLQEIFWKEKRSLDICSTLNRQAEKKYICFHKNPSPLITFPFSKRKKNCRWKDILWIKYNVQIGSASVAIIITVSQLWTCVNHSYVTLYASYLCLYWSLNLSQIALVSTNIWPVVVENEWWILVTNQ